MGDPFHLSRFTDAQDEVYDSVLRELRRGAKESHWMWFIFPQIAGLGRSPTAQYFALSGLDEARAFLEHPVLGPRLLQCTDTIDALQNRTANQIFGSPDDMKLQSSMTMFSLAVADAAPFRAVIDHYFDGEPDQRTIEITADL